MNAAKSKFLTQIKKYTGRKQEDLLNDEILDNEISSFRGLHLCSFKFFSFFNYEKFNIGDFIYIEKFQKSKLLQDFHNAYMTLDRYDRGKLLLIISVKGHLFGMFAESIDRPFVDEYVGVFEGGLYISTDNHHYTLTPLEYICRTAFPDQDDHE